MATVLIVGAGAVGLYYGSRLLQAGHQVQFLARSNARQLKQEGLVVKGLNTIAGTPSDSYHVQKLDVAEDWESAREAEIVVLTTKTTANESIRELVASKVQPNGSLLIMQNGLGEEERFSKLLNPSQVFAAICFIGATLVEPNLLTYSGVTRVTIADFCPHAGLGAPSERAILLAETFSAAKIPTAAEGDHALVRWKKLLWNIPFNGLCIALDTNSGELLRHSDGLEMLRSVMREVLSAAAACGRQIEVKFAESVIERSYALGDYEPSMQVDLKNGRVLETEAIYQTPIEVSSQAGFSMDLTALLLAQVRYKALQMQLRS